MVKTRGRFQASDADMHVPRTLAQSRSRSGYGWISQNTLLSSSRSRLVRCKHHKPSQPRGEEEQAKLKPVSWNTRYTAKVNSSQDAFTSVVRRSRVILDVLTHADTFSHADQAQPTERRVSFAVAMVCSATTQTGTCIRRVRRCEICLGCGRRSFCSGSLFFHIGLYRIKFRLRRPQSKKSEASAPFKACWSNAVAHQLYICKTCCQGYSNTSRQVTSSFNRTVSM